MHATKTVTWSSILLGINYDFHLLDFSPHTFLVQLVPVPMHQAPALSPSVAVWFGPLLDFSSLCTSCALLEYLITTHSSMLLSSPICGRGSTVAVCIDWTFHFIAYLRPNTHAISNNAVA